MGLLKLIWLSEIFKKRNNNLNWFYEKISLINFLRIDTLYQMELCFGKKLLGVDLIYS